MISAQPRRYLHPCRLQLQLSSAFCNITASKKTQDPCEGVPGEVFADVNKALDERTIGHNPERLCLMKVKLDLHVCMPSPSSCTGNASSIAKAHVMTQSMIERIENLNKA